ncbi:hypothetical protein LX64_05204 [Chitinophaga skermanii]|uniref:Uncharacterized protein n=1 Tax=Chitinophaga skermanii TaxID=331697 RepID=A0A327Q164_9BACT|nr:hypothetical protein [Chitinophaga skermanii]RAI96962.1 hypothetical protein LX64_05204 [Chitinophaga skermanii]
MKKVFVIMYMLGNANQGTKTLIEKERTDSIAAFKEFHALVQKQIRLGAWLGIIINDSTDITDIQIEARLKH